MSDLFPGIEPPELQASIDAIDRAIANTDRMLEKTQPGTQERRDIIAAKGALSRARLRLTELRRHL